MFKKHRKSKIPGVRDNISNNSHGMKYVLTAIKLSSVSLIILLLFMFQQCVFAQEEEDELKNQSFMYQRMYPTDSIPQDAYTDATEHQEDNYSTMGFYLQSPWQSIGPLVTGSGYLNLS